MSAEEPTSASSRAPKQLTEVQVLMRVEKLLDALPDAARRRLGAYLADKYGTALPVMPATPKMG